MGDLTMDYFTKEIDNDTCREMPSTLELTPVFQLLGLHCLWVGTQLQTSNWQSRGGHQAPSTEYFGLIYSNVSGLGRTMVCHLILCCNAITNRDREWTVQWWAGFPLLLRQEPWGWGDRLSKGRLLIPMWHRKKFFFILMAFDQGDTSHEELNFYLDLAQVADSNAEKSQFLELR